ncbi:MAG: OmpA family protein [Candidatus Hydrogenedentes bacterium]|nr:OmpA family protein [Candidatus Hydrogenedentota bacterium]
MSVPIRFVLYVVLALGLCLPGALAKDACKKCCMSDGKACCGEKCAKQGECTMTTFASPDSVNWSQKRVSFGNYLKFAKAEIPEPAVRQAPVFEPIYFDLDKAVLKPAGIETANKAVAYLKEHPNDKVRIEGNCCDLATNDYNVQLGQRRADAVKQYLVSQGIDAGRIAAVSNGEEKPVAGTDHRETNRRADVVVWFLDAAH